jgi:hypothetical protein
MRQIKLTRCFIVKRIARNVDPMTNGGHENCKKWGCFLDSMTNGNLNTGRIL